MGSLSNGRHQISKKKRSHSALCKAAVPLAAIEGELTQTQITSHYEVHAAQIGKWKTAATHAIKGCFSNERERSEADNEALIQGFMNKLAAYKRSLPGLNCFV